MSGAFNLGLIGYPLDHSLSPQIHGAALRWWGLKGSYDLFPIPPLPKGKKPLRGLLQQVRAGTIHGLNVTIPHKQNIIPLLDQLTPAAKAIGAVNTIYQQDDHLIGDNTDAAGFWTDLQRSAASVLPGNALILGAGGSARAVAYALLIHGCTLTIAARRIEQAQEISNQFSVFRKQINVIDLSAVQLPTTSLQLVINTTPVGMHPHSDASPWPDSLPFPGNVIVYDLVYNPRETLFVRQAHKAGLSATTGLGMLIEQAALAFERWTGKKAPRQVMAEAIEPPS